MVLYHDSVICAEQHISRGEPLKVRNMNIYVGVTDNNWYNFLAESRPDEVNFWQPGGRQKFKALQSNELFLFKLHSPLNYIAGGGFYVRHSLLPVSLAWKAFGNKNGTADYPTFLQAIKPFSQQGPNLPSNGLLLRQDLHTLLDRGYITITNDFNIEVSKRIKEDYGNGRDYYAYHGHKLIELPKQVQERPSPAFLRWHNENVFLG